MRVIRTLVWIVISLLGLFTTHARAAEGEYHLAPGDVIKVSVFQNPDLTLEARVSGNGTILYPLVGEVKLSGMTLAGGADKIAKALMDGGFLKSPQVNILLEQALGNQVSVLGSVNRPGRYPLDAEQYRLTDVIALAGGVAADNGSDNVILMGTRDGKPYRVEVNIPSVFLDDKPDLNVQVKGGDTLYVGRAAMFYVYGEVQRPGAFRLERNMTVMQGLAQGGGVTTRGSEKSLRVYRHDRTGKLEKLSLDGSAVLEPNDVIYVPESLF